jgi:hypothetical protein
LVNQYYKFFFSSMSIFKYNQLNNSKFFFSWIKTSNKACYFNFFVFRTQGQFNIDFDILWVNNHCNFNKFFKYSNLILDGFDSIRSIRFKK